MTLAALEQRLGYEFADPTLLRRALSHRSWVAEASDGEVSNERLEFLGDAVLGWVVADLVFARYADLAEGTLTDLRKSVVNALAANPVRDTFPEGEVARRDHCIGAIEARSLGRQDGLGHVPLDLCGVEAQILVLVRE